MPDPLKNQVICHNQPDNWAIDKLNDVLFGCILNVKLYQSGVCPKLIVDMNETDLQNYGRLLESIFLK